MDGILIIYKEKGFTSHDVVAKLRGILHQKKIGHTGTLDPDATGVLPVCIGNATKVCDILTDTDKTYDAIIRFGVTTDTQDSTGTVLKETIPSFSKDDLRDAVRSFLGETDQIPPMYSALKVNGKKLYELARQGIEVDRKPRKIIIHSIEVNTDKSETKGDQIITARLTVHCSKGTYIRTLCHDLGEKLGCGACMDSLERTRVGVFSMDKSHTLQQIEQHMKDSTIDSLLVSVDALFDYVSFCIIPEAESRLKNGNILSKNDFLDFKPVKDQEYVKIYDAGKIFSGIYQYNSNENLYKPYKMFLRNTK